MKLLYNGCSTNLESINIRWRIKKKTLGACLRVKDTTLGAKS